MQNLMTGQLLTGLTEAEAQERQARGLGNQVPLRSTRTYAQIFRENFFTFINMALFGLGLALVLLGRSSDAFISVGVILVNVFVNVIQEIRAKRELDRIALITRPTATVLREGKLKRVDPSEIVVGDTLALEAGDQVVVDGAVLHGVMEMDESLLTGESDAIRKVTADEVYSGSFCLTGSGYYEASKVGAESFSGKITAGARVFRRNKTPLQQEVNLVVRVLLLVALYFEFLNLVYIVIERQALVNLVINSVVIIGLVPNGLFLMIAMAYTLGAVRIVRKGALVQQANAIESLSNVNLLCLDKTGTLTTNHLYFHAVRPLQGNKAEFLMKLGNFAASLTSRNATTTAIAAACPGQAASISDEVPFSSQYKWSGVILDGEALILGAPEILLPQLQNPPDLTSLAADWLEQGLRVVACAVRPGQASLHNADGEPVLPAALTLLGLVCLGDELRPGIQETLAAFQQAGVKLKIISGDNPTTVAALVRQAGMQNIGQPVSGLELAGMDAEGMQRTVRNATVFGRITPDQKEHIIRLLRDQGNYVAMVGDGVNDVLSLKQANLAIAMQSGSQASRSVADMVLLQDNFSVLPQVLVEGQRILTGMQDILKVFLVRIIYMALLVLSSGFAGSFPLSPKSSSIISLFTVGIPTIFLTFWAKPGIVKEGSLLRRMIRFVLPAAFTLNFSGLFLFLGYLMAPTLLSGALTGSTLDFEVSHIYLVNAQTILASFSIYSGLILMLFLKPPTKWWVAGEHLSGDNRPTILAAVLMLVYTCVLLLSPGRRFFGLSALDWKDFAIIGVAVLAWTVTLRWIWRSRVLDRFLSADFDLD